MTEKKDFLDDLDGELSRSRFSTAQPSLFDAPAERGRFEWENGDPKSQKVIFKRDEDGDFMVQNAPHAQADPVKYTGGIDPAFTEPPPIIGADILAIRALTGKKQDIARQALHNAAVRMLEYALAECFYLRGNIPSLKNGKDIVTARRKDKKTGEIKSFSTLIPAAAVQDYYKEHKGQFYENKVAFLTAVRGLPLPVSLEFTFIRSSLRRFDFINATQIICDLMVEYGYFPDDDSVYICPVFCPVVYYSKDLAGVLIKIIK